MRRRRAAQVLVAVLTVIGLAATVILVRATVFGPTIVVADFSRATAIYPGDEVRVLGLRVGTIRSIDADGTRARITMAVDHGVDIPADARAVIVAQNLIAARYVQLTPVYRGGPTMADGAVIPIDRTATPVEWDEVKTQLARLATDLGPRNGVSQSSIGNLVDSAATALDGNGAKLRQTLTQLSAAGRILADGSGNIVDIIKGLQQLVTALRDSSVQIVSFQNRLASLTEVVDNSRSDLDQALKALSTAVVEVQRFVAGSRAQTSEQVQRLAAVTQILVDNQSGLENLLHLAPTTIANAYNIYNPNTGTDVGAFVFQNFSNPVQFLCAGIGAIENATAPDTAKLCAEYLGPGLRTLSFNYLPFPINPILGPSAAPDNILYPDPALLPNPADKP
ncbi:MCE family protein, partial [Mycolicibacterium sp. 018/SC-01/001]|uniref:MCE family protein n=1 Tax=Mycolicibacterium sp. 018/SC-01/001 TaxID=2592069 RepID=UPI0011810419